MWVADRWKEYTLLDSSGGEKLEKWGRFTLRRPDPQVIWQSDKKEKPWEEWNGWYHRSERGGGSWEFRDLPEEWNIHYSLAGGEKLTFRLKPFQFKHTGLFPEQAVNWDWFSELIRRRKEEGKQPKILNLFAYTGGATLAAAAAGAAVTHVDAAKGMVQWARENAQVSGLSEAPVRWLVDDCLKFVEREIRRGNTYDGIIMDPPSYGRGPKGEIWKLEENVYHLIRRTAALLSAEPLFFLINSYTTGLQPAVLSYMLKLAIEKDRGGKTCSEEIGLPVKETDLVLPCGASGRWVRT